MNIKKTILLTSAGLVAVAAFGATVWFCKMNGANGGQSKPATQVSKQSEPNDPADLPKSPDTSEPDKTEPANPEKTKPAPEPEPTPVTTPEQPATPATPAAPTTPTPTPTKPVPASPTTPTTVTPSVTRCTSGGSATSIAWSNTILDLVNAARVANGAGALNCKNELIPLAETRAQETLALFSHTRPNGQQWHTLNPNLMNGENLAVGFSTPQAVFDGWMASAGHRENILRPMFKSMAIGYFYTEAVANIPAEHCEDRNGDPNDQETECDGIYRWHVAQIFSMQP